MKSRSDSLSLRRARATASDRAAKFFECFPPLERSWRPVTEARAFFRMRGGFNGGTIEAHSEGAHRGSRFTVRLPCTVDAARRPEADAARVEDRDVEVPRHGATNGARDVRPRVLRVVAGLEPRVEATGGQVPVTYWVEQAAPHRVLKIAPVGVPLELVRAK